MTPPSGRGEASDRNHIAAHLSLLTGVKGDPSTVLSIKPFPIRRLWRRPTNIGSASGDSTKMEMIRNYRRAGLYALSAAAIAALAACDERPASLQTVSAPLSRGPDVLVHRYNLARTAANNSETTLTLANVNQATFGLLLTMPVDGYVFAQPLFKHGVAIGGVARDVVFVATAHDSIYAFEAATGNQLWHTSYINPPDITPQPYVDTGDIPPPPGQSGQDIWPEVGISSTPTIDPATGTMYVVTKTKESGDTFFRLHAVDITTGQDRVPNVVINPTFPGHGDLSLDGQVTFQATMQQQRPGLVLLNGVVYVAFGSSGDNFQWHGWLVGFRATDLSQLTAWNTTPNSFQGGIWSSGTAPAVDGAGNLFVPTGNGSFDGLTEFSSSVVRLSTAGGLAVGDYFTPFNQQALTDADNDVASGGLILLPDAVGTPQHPHLLTTSGKNGTIYLLDRDHLGGFSPSTGAPDGQIVQEIFNALGTFPVDNLMDSQPNAENSYTTPTYWRDATGRDHLYWGGLADSVKMFDLVSGQLSGPTSGSADLYEFPGACPSISSNGSSNGILWAVENSPNAAILHAYDATNLNAELWNSNQAANARDSLGPGVKFVVPTVVDGRVYVGAQSSVVVFGLLAPPPTVPALPPAAVFAFALLVGLIGFRGLRRAR
jgi:hypothetical protein